MMDAESIFDDEQADLRIFQKDVKLVAWACETLWHDQFRRTSPDNNEFMSLLPIAVLRMVAARAALIGADPDERARVTCPVTEEG